MEYSKSNNRKGLKITTGTNICKVDNYSFGLDEKTSKFLERQEEKRRLIRLQNNLLQITKHAVNISNSGFSYIEASKPKSK